MKNTNHNRIRFLIVFLIVSFFFNNCSQPGGISVQTPAKMDLSSTATPDPVPTQGPPDVNPPPISTDTTVALKTLQPALAVRGMACLMCHADVRANVITDFGYGDTWYLGGNLNFEAAGGVQSWFHNLAHTWQSMKGLKGSVIVPDAYITASVQKDIGKENSPPMTLQQLMTTPYKTMWNFDGDPAQENKAMDLKVTPELGQASVISKAQIKISSPIESEILALSNNPALAQSPSFVRVGSASSVQFSVQGSGITAYVKNNENQILQCENTDIIVNGSLYLKNLKVNATKGCRLYVTGTVFIENAISYEGPDTSVAALQNLQITSANAIILGISTSRLQTRYNDRREAFISGPRSFEERYLQVLAEAAAIGTLVDAEDSNPRKSINFSGLLLNAPIVQGRYLGIMKGTIVAELALFAIGQFHFEFDDVFTKVDVLPLLKKPILTAQ